MNTVQSNARTITHDHAMIPGGIDDWGNDMQTGTDGHYKGLDEPNIEGYGNINFKAKK
jgi:hypothetical protein